MELFLRGTAVVDAVIAITLAEAAVLVWLYRRHGRGVRPADWALNLVSGLCLMLALRAVLADASVGWMLAALAAAGVAHASDMVRRWR